MKFVFVVGGVLSGLGKGIASASIGLLLKTAGYKVTAIKIDPYVSVDAGTMRPAEHGEVFVTDDGGEIDQDIGHYERFLNIDLSSKNNITTGKVFQNVIHKERHFHYQGRDVELIPDVINEIKTMIYEPSKGFDFTIVEVGGTTGDLENMPFLHAVREIGREYPSVYFMVTFLPFLKNVGELKTKPTQHAVSRLREIGIVPDFIITRNEIPIDKPRVETIAKRCFVQSENIIDDPDIDLVYKIPLFFEEADLAKKILKRMGVEKKLKKDLTKWRHFIKRMENPKKVIKLALVGKYVKHGSGTHRDVYISVIEAVNHAASAHQVGIDLVPIDSESVERKSARQIEQIFKNIQGIIVPQGWGSRGVEGKIMAVKYARENKVPFLGLCFGMQMAVVEFARHVVKLKKANSTEVDPKTNCPVIHIMPEQKKYLKINQYGGTIRLGAWPCKLVNGTRLKKIYKGKTKISERHRHRYEFNNRFRNQFEKSGLVISGTSPDNKLVEAIELKNHPFFIGTQFHPEYKSRPLSPHPVFQAFIAAAAKF